MSTVIAENEDAGEVPVNILPRLTLQVVVKFGYATRKRRPFMRLRQRLYFEAGGETHSFASSFL